MEPTPNTTEETALTEPNPNVEHIAAGLPEVAPTEPKSEEPPAEKQKGKPGPKPKTKTLAQPPPAKTLQAPTPDRPGAQTDTSPIPDLMKVVSHLAAYRVFHRKTPRVSEEDRKAVLGFHAAAQRHRTHEDAKEYQALAAYTPKAGCTDCIFQMAQLLLQGGKPALEKITLPGVGNAYHWVAKHKDASPAEQMAALGAD